MPYLPLLFLLLSNCGKARPGIVTTSVSSISPTETGLSSRCFFGCFSFFLFRLPLLLLFRLSLLLLLRYSLLLFFPLPVFFLFLLFLLLIFFAAGGVPSIPVIVSVTISVTPVVPIARITAVIPSITIILSGIPTFIRLLSAVILWWWCTLLRRWCPSASASASTSTASSFLLLFASFVFSNTGRVVEVNKPRRTADLEITRDPIWR